MTLTTAVLSDRVTPRVKKPFLAGVATAFLIGVLASILPGPQALAVDSPSASSAASQLLPSHGVAPSVSEDNYRPECLPPNQAADCPPPTRWASIVEATGFVDGIIICTWGVCGHPDSYYRQYHNNKGIILLDLAQMTLEQQPGPGWWYVNGTFIRDSFEKNATARAGIHRVDLSWSTGGLGMSDEDIVFTVSVSPTGEKIETRNNSLQIRSLAPEVKHTFTITATLPSGKKLTAPVVSATPLVDPNPDCLPSGQATECLSATNWAHVSIETGLIVTVAVCTPRVCGDPQSDYSRIYRERGIILVELVNTPAWVGWLYVDGQFIDPRPAQSGDSSETVDSEGTFGQPSNGSTSSPGADGTTDSGSSGEGTLDDGDSAPQATSGEPLDQTDLKNSEMAPTANEPEGGESNADVSSLSERFTISELPESRGNHSDDADGATGSSGTIVERIVRFLSDLVGQIFSRS